MSESMSVFIARQPVFDGDLEVFGYELLFRADDSESAGDVDPEAATSQVLMNAFTEFDTDDLVGTHPAFINFTRRLILEPPPFDRSRFVIEIGEEIPVDEQLVDAVRRLHESGFQVSVGAFEPGCGQEPLLPFADFIRCNVLAQDDDRLRATLKWLHDNGIGARKIAEKVETHERQQACRELGFDYFQGFFLSRPRVVSTAKIPENRVVVLKLLSEVRDPNLDMGDLEKTVTRDPRLVFKLLKLTNSAANRRAVKVKSIGHAMTMLGLNRIRSWVSMIALCDLDDKPDALQVQAILRARACEQLAERMKLGDGETYFSAGLFSLLPAFFDQPLETLLETINVTTEMRDALLAYDGDIGLVLKSVMDYESGDFDSLNWYDLHARGLDVDDLASVYIDACRWARGVSREVSTS